MHHPNRVPRDADDLRLWWRSCDQTEAASGASSCLLVYRANE